MKKLKIKGVEDTNNKPVIELGSISSQLSVKPKHEILIASSRGDGTDKSLTDLEDDDVMLLEFDGGIKIWTRVDQLEQDFPEAKLRGGDGDTFTISSEFRIGDSNRGTSEWILRKLKIFGIDPVKKVATSVGQLVEKGLEGRLGLYRCTIDPEPDPDQKHVLKLLKLNKKNKKEEKKEKKEKEESLDGSKPVLLFIHGTASSTVGSFGELWNNTGNEYLQKLQAHFGKHIYAFEHKTLTESPIENAVQLVEEIQGLIDSSASPIKIHMVTHSRGGLVGELLARVDTAEGIKPISEEEIELYSSVALELSKTIEKENKQVDPYEGHAKNLKKLSDLLNTRFKSGNFVGKRKFTIHRFVRTACPARGTTLASERLDRWLSVTMNLIGQIPILKASKIYDAFTAFTLAVVKEKSNPKTIPGLEAQMPTSPLIRMLNLTNTIVDADLNVISGDIEPDSFWGKLKLLIPDLYYRNDHDLVVDTRSMTGGTRRKESSSRNYFERGQNVNHFSYFKNSSTANMLVNGLIRKDEDNAGYTPIVQKPSLMRSRSAKISGEKPIVFVLPGIMGSHLQVGENRVWLDFFDIVRGGMKKIAFEAENISAEALIGNTYADLVEYLQDGFDTIPFPYDWRISLIKEGQRFAEDLELKLKIAEEHNQPLHIIAHSMGGLLARAAFANKPDLWDRMVACDGRLLMLGTPNQGSHSITRVIVGQEKLVRNLALIDFSHNQKELLEIISKFPGVLQLLPANNRSMDMLDISVWEKLAKANVGNWFVPKKDSLNEAKSFWKEIENFKLAHKNILYVAGKARVTPMDVETTVEGFNILATTEGDGRVTWESGIPSNIRSWYANTSHGSLADYHAAFSGYVEILTRGDTENKYLGTEKIVDRDEPNKPFIMSPEDYVDVLPDEEMVIDSILGTERRNKMIIEPSRLKVIVSHGDLCYASNPLALGHYQNDGIYSAEGYVNKLFNNRLNKRMHLGLYPGPLNTAEVVYNPDPPPEKPQAALIVGLGKTGGLTRGKLAQTYQLAALEFAISEMEKQKHIAEDSPSLKNMKLSSLLIGTGAGGISLEDSLLAMLQGILEANRQLREMKCNGYQFVEVEFIERWEDLANAAAHAIRVVNEDAGIQNQLIYDKALSLGHKDKAALKINKIAGARKRVTFDESAGWWNRLQILYEAKDRSLRFNTITEKARTEITLQAIDLAQVDSFIEQSISSTYDNPEISKTLYEILIPHELKEQAHNQKDLVLLLNENSARYPWELLQNRWANKNRAVSNKESLPISVEYGMIRQLESETFRRSPSTHGDQALVIGNPLGNPDFFPPLPGAASEARAVENILRSRNYAVEPIFGRDSKTDAEKVILALHKDAYRIIHFAGHGVYRHKMNKESKVCNTCGQDVAESTEVTGMIIGENAFLTPANIESIRFVPDLVFINCCHLGREENKKPLESPQKIAANLATQFIRMGVKAVIAAGWAVNDRAAETFANTFYSHMLDGGRFGDSVRQARKATYLQYGGSNTWGAYQCYGNPDFQLKLDGKSTYKQSIEEYVSESELAAAIDHIACDSQVRGLKLDKLVRRLNELEDRIPNSWKTDCVNEALGKAFAELGEPAKAVTYYSASVEAQKSEASFRTIEQLANQKVKLAIELFNKDKSKNDPNSLKQVESAITDLQNLLNFGHSGERLSLLASAYKRKAWITTGNARIAALKKMLEYYEEAKDLAPGDSYPLFNYLTAKMVVNWRSNNQNEGKELQNEVNILASSVEGNDQQIDFWKLVEYADYQLLRSLILEEVGQSKESIISLYSKAKKRAGSPKEFNSVTEHIEFLMLIAKTQIKTAKKRNETVSSLRHIFDTLKNNNEND